uniref:Immunoglobulin I-set domain-containing protein n=1 Tax=Stegastes partitus TaxID=144197 RepID=A0A3B5BAY7_9TELE
HCERRPGGPAGAGSGGRRRGFVPVVGFCPPTEPPCILEKPESMNVLPGSKVKVCGTPELVPKWFKDGVELASGRKYKISFSRMISSLNVLSAEKMDSGEYTFEVMNEVGKDLSKINLTVLGVIVVPSASAFWVIIISFTSEDTGSSSRRDSFCGKVIF